MSGMDSFLTSSGLIPPPPGEWREKISDFPAAVYDELEKHVKPIDSKLYSYMIKASKDLYTLNFVGKSIISVGAYPYRRKIEEMKKAFSEGGQALSRLSPFFQVKVEYLPSSYRENVFIMGDLLDPVDPDAPLVPPELMRKEIERRTRWENAWRKYMSEFREKIPTGWIDLNGFPCDLSPMAPIPKISPRLRLPSGEYLEPVISAAGTLPVSEEKKEEKEKFPWWAVALIGVVVVFFIMRD
jgi:hypothetical protein